MAKRNRKTQQKSNVIDTWFDNLLNTITSNKDKNRRQKPDHVKITYDEVIHGDVTNKAQNKEEMKEDSLFPMDTFSEPTLAKEAPSKEEQMDHQIPQKPHRVRRANLQKRRQTVKSRKRSGEKNSAFSQSINDLFDKMLAPIFGGHEILNATKLPDEKFTHDDESALRVLTDKSSPAWNDPKDQRVDSVPVVRNRKRNIEKKTLRRKIRKRETQTRSSNRAKKANLWKYLPYEWRRGWETFLFKIYLRSMPHDPWLENREPEKEARSVFVLKELEYVFSSLMTFVFAGLVAWLIYQLSVILTASFFGISSVLYYYEVMFPVGNSSPLWTQHSIIMITLSGPLTSLILGLVTFFYVIKKKKTRGLNRLFFMWLSFHLFNQFFGSFVAGVITDQGFGYVANWLYMGTVLKFAFSVVALFVMGFAGYKVMPYLLTTAGKPERLKMDNRISFVVTQALLPCLLGSIFLLLLRLPNKTPQHQGIFLYDFITAGALIILLIGMFFNLKAKIASVNHRVSNYKVSLVWLIGLLILILAVRLGLSQGLLIVFQVILHVSSFN